MISCDVNVLIYAHNDDDPRSADYQRWLNQAANGDEPLGLSSVVASGFLRIVTHPRILTQPLATERALDLMDELWAAPAVLPLEPGPRHWAIFDEVCRAAGARGNAIPDAYLAALAIEHGCTWYSADRGFARYKHLRHRHPLDP